MRWAEVTGLPEAWFTADWDQLEPGWVAPIQKIDRLEKIVEELIDSKNELLGRVERLTDALESKSAKKKES